MKKTLLAKRKKLIDKERERERQKTILTKREGERDEKPTDNEGEKTY